MFLQAYQAEHSLYAFTFEFMQSCKLSITEAGTVVYNILESYAQEVRFLPMDQLVLHLHFWPVDRPGNHFVQVETENHQDCPFQFSKSEWRHKCYNILVL